MTFKVLYSILGLMNRKSFKGIIPLGTFADSSVWVTVMTVISHTHSKKKRPLQREVVL